MKLCGSCVGKVNDSQTRGVRIFRIAEPGECDACGYLVTKDTVLMLWQINDDISDDTLAFILKMATEVAAQSEASK